MNSIFQQLQALSTNGFAPELNPNSIAYAAPASPNKPFAEGPRVRKSFDAPPGYEFTGEFKVPENEWFLDTSLTPARPVYAGSGFEYPFPILRPKERGVPVKVTSGQPSPPAGWKITGRGEIQDGGYFMATGDSRVWQKGSGIYNRLFAWICEPTIPKPAGPPTFRVTGEYRLPLIGEWFLAKGGGPVAKTNEPVKLGIDDIYPTGPRWILALEAA